MAYYLDLFSPETYEAFTNSTREVSGFRISQQNAASKIKIGDKLICYVTKLSRWVGVLEIQSNSYQDDTPIFYDENDPFVVRFKVRPIAWLSKDKAIPIHEDIVWNILSFTKAHDKRSSTWTGKVRISLRQLPTSDGEFLEKLIIAQQTDGKIYEVNDQEYAKLITHRIRRSDKVISVTVPQETKVEEEVESLQSIQKDIRESIKIQALIASIGEKMGMKIWIPRNDRAAVIEEWKGSHQSILQALPLNYDETTLKTIEQIDVLWLRGRAIIRAFEVEHTTSIYSGILRMADLLALQPNMDIKLHLVAPYTRREKVFQELQRPVFSLLDKGPLFEYCTFISYDSLKELAQQRHLAHLSDSVLDEYVEVAE